MSSPATPRKFRIDGGYTEDMYALWNPRKNLWYQGKGVGALYGDVPLIYPKNGWWQHTGKKLKLVAVVFKLTEWMRTECL